MENTKSNNIGLVVFAIIVSIVASVITSLFIIPSSTAHAAAPNAKEQYLFVELNPKASSFKDVPGMEKIINEAAADGWTLRAVLPTGYFIFAK